MAQFELHSIGKWGAGILAAGLLTLCYSMLGPDGPPIEPPASEGASYNQQYQRELREYPATAMHFARAGRLGDRLLFVGGLLLLCGAVIPIAGKGRSAK